MIEIEQVFEDYCEGCPFLEPEVNTLRTLDSIKVMYISCSHMDLCKRIAKMLKEEKK